VLDDAQMRAFWKYAAAAAAPVRPDQAAATAAPVNPVKLCMPGNASEAAYPSIRRMD
jgi:hypothetical protein